MKGHNISLLYAPPFSIVARFFLTACLFGLLGSLLGVYMTLENKLHLQSLVHAFTLGFAGMTMVGALFQMLPVVAGVVIENPLKKATYTHITFSMGVIFLTVGFWKFNSIFLSVSILLLSISLLYILSLMLFKLFRIKNYSPTPSGMRYALASAILGTLLGIASLMSYLGIVPKELFPLLKNLHMNFMLLGWIGILISSVAFQVIEMFFVTSPYPRKFSKFFPPVIFLLIALDAFEDTISRFVIPLGFIGFAFLTINLLINRQRKVSDPLVGFWYTGMFFLIVSMIAFILSEADEYGFFIFLATYGMFVHSIILAMMYRIIPFLVWLNLSNKGVPQAPTMHEVINPLRIRIHFYLHIALSRKSDL